MSTTSAAIFIPGHVPSSKNSRIRTGTGLFIASRATQKYRKDTKETYRALAKQFRTLTEGKKKPLKVGFHFVRRTRHKYDWPNPLQTVLDEMVRYNWVPDDNVTEIIPVPFTRKGEYSTHDPKNAGVYIKIYS